MKYKFLGCGHIRVWGLIGRMGLNRVFTVRVRNAPLKIYNAMIRYDLSEVFYMMRVRGKGGGG